MKLFKAILLVAVFIFNRRHRLDSAVCISGQQAFCQTRYSAASYQSRRVSHLDTGPL